MQTNLPIGTVEETGSRTSEILEAAKETGAKVQGGFTRRTRPSTMLAIGALSGIVAAGQGAIETGTSKPKEDGPGHTNGQASPEAKQRLADLREQATSLGKARQGKGNQHVKQHKKAKGAVEPFTLQSTDRKTGAGFKTPGLSANDTLSSAIALMGVALETGGALRLTVTDSKGVEVFKVDVNGFQEGVVLPLMDDLRAAQFEDQENPTYL